MQTASCTDPRQNLASLLDSVEHDHTPLLITGKHGKLAAAIRECCRTPFAGVGRHAPLRVALSGWWCSRLTGQYRPLSRLNEGDLLIPQSRYLCG